MFLRDLFYFDLVAEREIAERLLELARLFGGEDFGESTTIACVLAMIGALPSFEGSLPSAMIQRNPAIGLGREPGSSCRSP